MKKTAVRALCKRLRKARKALTRMYAGGQDGAQSTAGEQLLAFLPQLCEAAESGLRDLRAAPGLPAGESGLPRAFERLQAFVQEPYAPTLDSLASSLAGGSFSFTELTLTGLLFRTACVLCAAESEDAEQAVRAAQALQEAAQTDFARLFAHLSDAERICLTDAGFRVSDDQTKAAYRERLTHFAKKQGVSEEDAAQKLMQRAAAENTTLWRLLWEKERFVRGRVLTGLQWTLSWTAAAAVAGIFGIWWLLPLLWMPLFAGLSPILERLVLRRAKPKIVPTCRVRSRVGSRVRTLVTVSALLPEGGREAALSDHLEEVYLSAGRGALGLALLADLKAAPSAVRETDNADIAAAKRMIDALNEKYPGRFVLLVRGRTFSETQNAYTGFERKRGALCALFALLAHGDASAFSVCHGAQSLLRGVHYVFALDADASPAPDCLFRLLAAARHPENAPQIDENARRVTRGYGIFVPQAEVSAASAFCTRFSRLTAGTGGVSGYVRELHERWQTLSGASLFTGKGLMDVAACASLLPGLFPKETVLSHDIPEGEVLRTAFVGAAQVTEGCPSALGSHLARLGRWVRGDAQNLVLLRAAFPDDTGRAVRLPAVSRYKLFDCLRRDLTPAASFFLCLLSPLLQPAAQTAVLLCVLLSLSVPAALAFFGALRLGGVHALSARYFGGALPEAAKAVSDFLLSLVLLPVTGWFCLCAFFKGAWRRLFSHRRMLDWVTAADAEGAGFSPLRRSLPAFACGVWLLLFGGALARAFALFFLAAPAYAVWSAKPYRNAGKTSLSPAARETLRQDMAAMWRFYEDLCNPETHFLPPDNVQFAPVRRTAYRTSPTNIGLMLCAALSACDVGLISTEELGARVCRTLETVQRLKTWRGNLYNWYDVKTLEPLPPQFVSAVDSGNFLCCLAALISGLSAYEARQTCRRARQMAESILRNTHLGALYDWGRDLFYIGFDADRGTFSSGHYDLLMSESRMMSYYAVAARAVPVSHWGALSRALSAGGGFTGSLAWSGTMFEFFMPHLFLESPPGTLASESLHFCVREQARYAKRQGILFGVSESGYAATDAAGNYQYRAHGVPALGLRRTAPAENRVSSPYSAYLCLPFSAHTAQKALDAYRARGMFGEYGFYEAIDCTDQAEGKLVRSFMAHHIGMSMLAVANLLCGNVFQKRFSAYGTMRSAHTLLSERVPNFTPLPRRRVPAAVPARPARYVPSPEKPVQSPLPESAQVYTNGAWTLFLTDAGTSFAHAYGVDITRRVRADLTDFRGIFAVLQTESGTLPLTRACAREEKAVYTFEARKTEAVYTAKAETLFAETRAAVQETLPAERRDFRLCNKTGAPQDVTLLVYFEPTMTTERALTAHRTFQKLFVTAAFDKTQNAVVFTRRAGRGQPALALACGFQENAPFAVCLQRDEALSRDEGIFSLPQAKIVGQEPRGTADVCFAAVRRLHLPAHGEQTVTLHLCAADTREEALRRLEAVRRARSAARAPAVFPAQLWRGTILPALFCGGRLQEARKRALCENQNGVRALWALGISGDLPLFTLQNADSAAIEKLSPFLTGVGALCEAGLPCDLVLCVRDAPGAESLRETLRENAAFHRLWEAGRIRIAEVSAQTHEQLSALLAFSACSFDLLSPLSKQQFPENAPFVRAAVHFTKPEKQENGVENGGYRIAQKPRLPWCWVLSNPTFGTLVGDGALGTTFAMNARLNRLTEFPNDPMRDFPGELLFLRTADGKIYDLLRNAAAFFCGDRAVFETDMRALHIRVTVRVPARGMRKETEVLLENRSDAPTHAAVCYYTRPALCEDAAPSPFLRSVFQDGALLVRNPATEDFPGVLCLCAVRSESEKYCRLEPAKSEENFRSEQAESEKYFRNAEKEAEKYFRLDEDVFYTVSDEAFFGGGWDAGGSLPRATPCAALGKTVELAANGRAQVRFHLTFARRAAPAVTLARACLPASLPQDRVQLCSNDRRLDDLYNLFLVRQTENGRLFARAGFYQAGGAWGFRDQLQDAASLLALRPELLRRQLLRCAAAQFSEGDVLHWWHVLPNGTVRGVRTRCSDDLLWLPLFLAKYVLSTGDRSILSVEVPYREAPVLRGNEDERYFEVKRTTARGSVLDHAVRAVRYALEKKGEHGLMLMGTGDWNDSFNRVGRKGRGESVWLSQFAVVVLEAFAALLEGDAAQSEFRTFCLSEAKVLREAIETHAYAGDRYLRAFYDDGGKMGAAGNAACAVDCLTQSFAVFARLDKARTETALRTAFSELFDEENGILRLFSPPFSDTQPQAGYVSAYPPGVRENGGQYTHAAVWFCRALLEAGMYDEGMRVLRALNPLVKYETEETARRYKTEPYFLCGDVYGEASPGRGGWSLYTGAAGQLFALVTEVILGLHMQDGRLFLTPAEIPQMGAFSYTLILDGAEISVEVAAAPRAGLVLIDGSPAAALQPDGKNHHIKIR